MTLSEDLNLVDQGVEFEEATSNSPVVFGITLTPKMIGILVGVVGLVGALYLVMNQVMPAWETYQQKQTTQNDLQGQVDQKKNAIKQIEKVKDEQAQAKKQQLQVLAVFANEKTLDTLLLDLNRLVEAGNTQLPTNAVKAQLKKFAPIGTKAEPINDGSFGPLVDGKLKRRSINIEIIGTYEQTQSILRNIERLQPLLIVKDYQSTLAPDPIRQQGETVVRVGPAPISTKFQLQALMPLKPEEIAAATQAKK